MDEQTRERLDRLEATLNELRVSVKQQEIDYVERNLNLTNQIQTSIDELRTAVSSAYQECPIMKDIVHLKETQDGLKDRVKDLETRGANNATTIIVMSISFILNILMAVITFFIKTGGPK